jgi:hypothetical protein
MPRIIQTENRSFFLIFYYLRSAFEPVSNIRHFTSKTDYFQSSNLTIVHYTIFLNMVVVGGMEQPWQAYQVTVEPLECRYEAASSRRHYGLARFVTPWALDTTQVWL